LKNDRNLLPLEPNNPNAPKAVKRIAVLGFNADVAITSGGGAADLLPSYTVTPLAGIRSAAREVWNLEDQDVPYAVGAPTFRYVPLLSRYLFNKSGEVGGLVQFWNGPFDATGLQQSAPVFETTTTSSLMLFNDHIRE
jgi:beta-glucosidase